MAPAALAWSCADDVQVVPWASRAVAVRVVRAPAGSPCTDTGTGTSSNARAGTEIAG
jgi:hypothetical protein